MAVQEYYAKANEAFVDENYDEALKLFNEALKVDKDHESSLLGLSQLLIKLEKFGEALHLINKVLDKNSSSFKALFKKGVILFNLKKFEESLQSFKEILKMKNDDVRTKEWIDKCEKMVAKQLSNQQNQNDEKQPLSPKINNHRHDWYQTETQVIVNILVKNVSSDQFKYDINSNNFSCFIKLSKDTEYNLDFDLYHPILADQSLVKIYPTKIEVKLKKEEGTRWEHLEKQKTQDMEKLYKNKKPSNSNQSSSSSSSCSSSTTSSYPSSFHHKTDWNKLETEIKKEEKDEKLEGDAALNQLFQQIYADGSDEVKKAMMKSFSESGGTVLSTNWKEIGEKKVEVKPPDGMEFKKWQN